MSDWFDSFGRFVKLGSKLGSGGEGDVYEVSEIGQDLAAKIYHEPASSDKQEKLKGMVRVCDDSLKVIAAWPTATLHLGRNGPIRGFIMPKVTGYEPIHKLYSPAHRKQQFPKADWAFLVNTARNVAAAFEALHRHNHLISDVNQGNVVVANNSVVKLIDCDSFQITNNGKSYLCDVGVPHFTPPELQGAKSFYGICRTPNHDNFGLAVLCFHLLFMGRHPFSGIYSGREDMPIERAIQGFRFAFGKGAPSKGMSPPPNTVTMEVVPQEIAGMFEQAFSESGAQAGNRPVAREWVKALDYLKQNLRTCGEETMHKYFGGLAACPWCALERRSGVLFFIGLIATTAGQSVFNLTVTWQKILAVPSPGEAPSINLGQFVVNASPVPFEIKRGRKIAALKKASAVGLIIATCLIYPIALWVVILIAIGLFFSGVDDSSERKIRQSALRDAQLKWGEAERRWKREAGDGIFKEKLQELTKLKSEYENLDAEYGREKQRLTATIKERQLHKFLEAFFIDDYRVPGIGQGRKATLSSFGIETAADISWNRVHAIDGFGNVLTGELVSWRKSLESKFVFDPSKGIDPTDVAALNQKFRHRRAQIENTLLAGPELLTQVIADASRRRQLLKSGVEAAARTLAQSQADMSVLKSLIGGTAL